MSCTTICKNFKLRTQEVNFEVDVFSVDLNNYDIVLETQRLAILNDIVSNYKEL